MSKKTINKNNLEILVNEYLQKGIPLAFILEEYKLTDKQLSIIINIIDESNKKIGLNENISSNNLSFNLKDLEQKSYKEKIIFTNINLVNLCISYFFRDIPFPKEDVFMHGLEGLIEAANNYEEKSDKIFSVYAISFIIANIKKYFHELVGISWKDFVNNYEVLLNQISIADFDDNIDYINKELLEDDEIDFLLEDEEEINYESEEEKYDMPFTDEDYAEIDSYEDENSIVSNSDVSNQAIYSIMHEDIMNSLYESNLNDRDREILFERFGLRDNEQKSLEEVSQMFYVSPERIRFLEAKALRKLRNSSKIEKLKSYYDGDRKSKFNKRTIARFLELEKEGWTDKGIIAYINCIYNEKEWTLEDLNRAREIIQRLDQIIEKDLTLDMNLEKIVEDIAINNFYYKYFPKNKIREFVLNKKRNLEIPSGTIKM